MCIQFDGDYRKLYMPKSQGSAICWYRILFISMSSDYLRTIGRTWRINKNICSLVLFFMGKFGHISDRTLRGRIVEHINPVNSDIIQECLYLICFNKNTLMRMPRFLQPWTYIAAQLLISTKWNLPWNRPFHNLPGNINGNRI